MSTELEQRLREALHEDAQRARLVSAGGPPAPEARPLIVEPHWRRPARWLAAAAVASVLALVGALTLLDDDQAVDTTPATPAPVEPAPRTVVSGSGCPFGISGDAIEMELGPAGGGARRFDPVGGQGVAHTTIGAQVAEVHVPGVELNEPDGWRMEGIELDRRAATVWLDGPPSGAEDEPFVQVRFFPETDEPCSSFTVTVDGGSEAANRQTAIDLADRIILPSEVEGLDLPGAEGGPVAGLQLAGTEWVVVHTSNGPPSGIGMSFSDTTVTWDDGCATVSADYELDRADGFLTLRGRASSDPGCTPPTIPGVTPPWPAIDAVMGAEQIPVRFIAGQLQLGVHPQGAYLILEAES